MQSPNQSERSVGDAPDANPKKPEKLTEKQLRWVEEYPKHFNASRAARDAGYSAESAADMGYQNKQNPALMALVDERHKALTMSADEATRHLSDMAATRLNDFLVVREVQGYEMREEYVTVLRTHAQNKLKRLQEAAKKLPKKNNPFDASIAELHIEIVGYDIEIERFGDDVARLVPGRPIVAQVTEFDLVALAKAKDVGRIKKFKHTKEGVEVETYAADNAARDILKLNGRYEKHNQQKKAEVTITIGGRTISSQPAVSDET
ncbi:terminase small subunit [Hymenobacter sp. YC55]|uniref:terminase small subunit n=1 Tax=Hymenobacter sp. YC55 TaxID=3034019 RepID=UPI0023F9FB43|nr:terminase small subunit [Hymenobacter sp. YC55]MDF7810935.1 terminase small subunit [Hymenobacter sp. YC55]